jgi:hypothetical protein
MGIWADIKNTQAAAKEIKQLDAKADALTPEAFHEFMTTLKGKSKSRELIVQTGVGGMRMIQDAMQTQVYLKLMKQLNFSREERKRLGKMINSPDHENFQIAKILIDNKQKETKEYYK